MQYIAKCINFPLLSLLQPAYNDTGSIPSAIGSLASLTVLSLATNHFRGKSYGVKYWSVYARRGLECRTVNFPYNILWKLHVQSITPLLCIPSTQYSSSPFIIKIYPLIITWSFYHSLHPHRPHPRVALRLIDADGAVTDEEPALRWGIWMMNEWLDVCINAIETVKPKCSAFFSQLLWNRVYNNGFL